MTRRDALEREEREHDGDLAEWAKPQSKRNRDKPPARLPEEKLTLKVGDKLWCVDTKHNRSLEVLKEVTVTTVGRKWFSVSSYSEKFAIETLRMDLVGGVCRARCYRDRQEYDAELAIEQTFIRFRQGLDYKANTGVTENDIRQAAALLRVDL